MHKYVWLSYCVSRRIVFRILNCSLPMPEEKEGEKKKEISWISNVCQNKYSNIKFFPKKTLVTYHNINKIPERKVWYRWNNSHEHGNKNDILDNVRNFSSFN